MTSRMVNEPRSANEWETAERSPGSPSLSAPRFVVEPAAPFSASGRGQGNPPPTPSRETGQAPAASFVVPELVRLKNADRTTRGVKGRHSRFRAFWPNDAYPAGPFVDEGGALRTGPVNDHRMGGRSAEDGGVTYRLRSSPASGRVPAEALDPQIVLGIPPPLSCQQRIPSPSAASATQAAPRSVHLLKHIGQEQGAVAVGRVGDGSRDHAQVLISINVDDLNVLAPHDRWGGPRTGRVQSGKNHGPLSFVPRSPSLSLRRGLGTLDVVATVRPKPLLESAESP